MQITLTESSQIKSNQIESNLIDHIKHKSDKQQQAKLNKISPWGWCRTCDASWRLWQIASGKYQGYQCSCEPNLFHGGLYVIVVQRTTLLIWLRIDHDSKLVIGLFSNNPKTKLESWSILSHISNQFFHTTSTHSQPRHTFGHDNIAGDCAIMWAIKEALDQPWSVGDSICASY